MHLATVTRLDIAYSVHKLSRGVNNPTRDDWNGVQRVYKYLNGTKNLRITYQAERQPLRIYEAADV